MLLINPPVAKPCEPPAGIALLAGALRRHGISHGVLDANLEGLLYLLRATPAAPSNTWTRRALRNLPGNLSSLKDPRTYAVFDRYQRAVVDLNRVLEKAVSGDAVVSLSNYRHAELSPVKSVDLLRAAETPAENPFYPYFKQRLSDLIERDGPTAVGISLNYLSQALCAFAAAGFLKKEFPSLRLILGGGLVTSWMRRPGWRNPFQGLFDDLVEGPGEQYLLTLAGVKGLMEKHYTPSYDSFPLDGYLSPGFILPYSGSVGCSWSKCSFCPEKAERSPYRQVPARRMAHDCSALAEKTQPVLLHLLDNEVGAGHMKALIDNPPGVPWYGFARVSRLLTDHDFCKALKRSGCVMLKLGLESGDREVLDALGKGIDPETSAAVLAALKRAGIAAYVYLLFGTPVENEAAARKTLAFTAAHRGQIDHLNLAVFNMPIYGLEAARYATSPFYEGDLSLYTDFDHPEGWNRKKVRSFLETDFKKHPAVAAILKKDPPFFTSNHAPFFHL